MTIELDALLGAEEMTALIDYEGKFSLRIAYVPAEELEKFARKHEKTKRGAKTLSIPPQAERDFWLAHVSDWEGLSRDGEPVPFDAAKLQAMWARLPADFRVWLQEACQDLDRFCGSTAAAEDVPLREAS